MRSELLHWRASTLALGHNPMDRQDPGVGHNPMGHHPLLLAQPPSSSSNFNAPQEGRYEAGYLGPPGFSSPPILYETGFKLKPFWQ